jgi:hypothetical protein
MLSMFERATWPLRRLAWWIEEKVIWPLADAIRGTRSRSDAAEVGIATEAAIETDVVATETVATEAGIESTRRPDVRIALGVVAAAAVVGVGVAALVGNIGPGQHTVDTPPSAPSLAAQPTNAPVTSKSETEDPSTLQGVSPDFESSAKARGQATNAGAATATTSPTKSTNDKPSSIPPGVADDVAALHTARDFAGAFVLYEVGKTNAKVKQTFARTATPALARALRDRPPRLPDSVKVPTAKVQNVVLGTLHAREVEASVSLLRLGDLSEIRLTLAKRHRTWAVSEVRG